MWLILMEIYVVIKIYINLPCGGFFSYISSFVVIVDMHMRFFDMPTNVYKYDYVIYRYQYVFSAFHRYAYLLLWICLCVFLLICAYACMFIVIPVCVYRHAYAF